MGWQIDWFLKHGKGNLSAEVNRFLIEEELAEKFGWTVKQIRETPYNWILMYNLKSKIMPSAMDERAKLEQFKAENKNPSNANARGATKRWVNYGG
jgi:hypothetical protein